MKFAARCTNCIEHQQLLARARILRFLQVFPYHWRRLKDLKKCLKVKSRTERSAWHFVSSIFLQMGHKQIADMHRSDPFSLEQCEVLLNGVQIMTPLLIKGAVETCWHFYKLLPAVLESFWVCILLYYESATNRLSMVLVNGVGVCFSFGLIFMISSTRGGGGRARI